MTETDDPGKPPAHTRRARPPPLDISLVKLRRVGLIAAGVALLIAVAGITIREVNARTVAQWTLEQALPSVSVVLPQHAAEGSQVVLPGNIEAWFQAPIYARVNGYLQKWYFDLGAHVKAGQVLATIDTPDLDAQFTAAQADLNASRANVQVAQAAMDFAKTTYARWRDSPKGVVSMQETESKKEGYASALARYDAAVAGVKSGEGAVARLRALEQFKRIVAPFDGIVTVRNTDVGDLINAGSGAGGQQLFQVADMHRMRVFVQVPQAMSAGITAGMSADLDLPQYPGRKFQAVVATTAGAINPSARTLLVELYANNPAGQLQPGTYADVHFNLPANPDVLSIPTTALVFRRDGLQVAVVGPNGRVQLRSITLGRNLGNTVDVVTGLSASDRVIDSPPDSVADGELVSMAHPVSAPDSKMASGRRTGH